MPKDGPHLVGQIRQNHSDHLLTCAAPRSRMRGNDLKWDKTGPFRKTSDMFSLLEAGFGLRGPVPRTLATTIAALASTPPSWELVLATRARLPGERTCPMSSGRAQFCPTSNRSRAFGSVVLRKLASDPSGFAGFGRPNAVH